jgi:hypothetical protein
VPCTPSIARSVSHTAQSLQEVRATLARSTLRAAPKPSDLCLDNSALSGIERQTACVSALEYHRRNIESCDHTILRLQTARAAPSLNEQIAGDIASPVFFQSPATNRRSSFRSHSHIQLGLVHLTSAYRTAGIALTELCAFAMPHRYWKVAAKMTATALAPEPQSPSACRSICSSIHARPVIGSHNADSAAIRFALQSNGASRTSPT